MTWLVTENNLEGQSWLLEMVLFNRLCRFILCICCDTHCYLYSKFDVSGTTSRKDYPKFKNISDLGDYVFTQYYLHYYL